MANTPVPAWQPRPLPSLEQGVQLTDKEQVIIRSLIAAAPKLQQLRLQLLLNENQTALTTLLQWRSEQQHQRANANPFALMQFELLARARLTKLDFKNALPLVFNEQISPLTDQQAHQATAFVSSNPAQHIELLQELHQQLRAEISQQSQLETEVNPPEKVVIGSDTTPKVSEKAQANTIAELQRRYFSAFADYYLLSPVLQLAEPLVNKDRQLRYIIDTQVMITTPAGIKLSAMVVRSKGQVLPQPAILTASIYADEKGNLRHAIAAAAHGYVGVVSDSRGKRLSTEKITPYENETADVSAVIDWLSRQPWCDGQVAMYGGSYLGFTRWAAAKNLPKALKTIVPAVAAIPGQGLPMENNIFLNANYAWPFYVSNGRYNDNKAYSAQDWDDVSERWYQSGRSYRDFDQFAGQPNPWLQKWLQHPAFDGYWQSLVPNAAEYTKLKIPVLTLTGYYDDGQISALQYLKDHTANNPDAEHYLVIGPYDHFSAQHGTSATTLRDYQLDQVAHIDISALTFDWFDYVLKGKAKPKLLKDKINYQLMGTNRWAHAPSIAALSAQHRFYFGDKTAEGFYALQSAPTKKPVIAAQQIDFKDRSQSYNQHYYPWPIQQNAFTPDNGLALMSAPLPEEMEIAGTFSGELHIKINKQDVDLGLTLFEVTETGAYFHLSYWLGRASYANHPATRRLLKPGQAETVVFSRSRMTGKKIAKGSRLLLLANVNLNANAQINYGTGKDVSDETVADAAQPLLLEWLPQSFIDLPLRRIGSFE
ncbi:MAG: CocE/NonD family hydrolase [Gammaproteobacteria bacterium]|nr:CocE/NonD family hydrolase [Gammaproteobacteria bacterium]